MWIQKAPKSRPKAIAFQTAVPELYAVRLNTVFVESDVFHFLNNVQHWEPAKVTFTLLVCVRQEPSSIDSKNDVIPA